MSEPTNVKWGILAPSGVAGRFVPDLQTSPGAEVLAVASRDKDRAAQFAAAHKIPRSYGSYAELVQDPDVDAVYVSSVHTGHYEHSKLALENGKAVLVEKPFSVNARQASELVEIARARKLFLMEAMWTRCHPLVHEVKAIVDRGDIGDVTLLEARLAPIGLPDGFRALKHELAGGALLECGVYPINWAYYLLGIPDTFDAQAHFLPSGVDGALSMLFKYPGSTSAVLSTSIIEGVASGLPSSAFISGTKGWIDVPRDIFDPGSFTVHRAGKEPETRTVAPIGSGYTYEATEATRAIAAGELESPMMPLDASLDIMRLMDGIREHIGLRYAED